MKLTLAECMARMNKFGDLDLSHTQVTELPDNLVVRGTLDLRGTPITTLPNHLMVGDSLMLSRTQVTELPNPLVVGGTLDLSYTPIATLPSDLAVGHWLFLTGTRVTALPNNLAVGGMVFHDGIPQDELRKVKKLQNGDYVEGQYLYCNGLLTHIKCRREVDGYTFYVGKIKGRNVVSDGEYYAYCKTFHDGVAKVEHKRTRSKISR